MNLQGMEFSLPQFIIQSLTCGGRPDTFRTAGLQASFGSGANAGNTGQNLESLFMPDEASDTTTYKRLYIMTKHLPNAITLLNLWCGCGALVAIFGNQPLAALSWLAVAALADFADGGLARLLKVNSPLGQQLDSLADMVSFGIVPGAIFFMMIKENLPANWPQEWALAGFVLSVFSGLRLGKFNIDTRQSDNFIGLATPASTILAMGLWLVYHFDSYGCRQWLGRVEVLLILVIVLSLLLISEIPMFSLKLKHRAWRGNEIKFIFAVVSIALVAVLQWASLAAIILLYILVNLFFYLIQRKTHS